MAVGKMRLNECIFSTYDDVLLCVVHLLHFMFEEDHCLQTRLSPRIGT